MAFEQLKLENQICFPVYAASRLITRAYQPHLDALGITYPQYLVMMVLWETDGLPVNYIAEKLILNTNTITPLLKRMEQNELLIRKRSAEDERKVIVSLTEKGRILREKAADIPSKLVGDIGSEDIQLEEIASMKQTLLKLIQSLSEAEV